MSEPELVQMNIALNDFFADPCLCPFTTGSDDLLENRVQPKLKLSFFQNASQTVRDVKRIEQNDPARIWRKPGDLSALHCHREYPGAIGFKEERGRNNARSTSIVHGRSCQLSVRSRVTPDSYFRFCSVVDKYFIL